MIQGVAGPGAVAVAVALAASAGLVSAQEQRDVTVERALQGSESAASSESATTEEPRVLRRLPDPRLCELGLLPRLSCNRDAPAPVRERFELRLQRMCSAGVAPAMVCGGKAPPAPTAEEVHRELRASCRAGLLSRDQCQAADTDTLDRDGSEADPRGP